MVIVNVSEVGPETVLPITASILEKRLGEGAAIEIATARSSPVTTMAGTCGNCGHIISRMDNYCSECGRLIERNG